MEFKVKNLFVLRLVYEYICLLSLFMSYSELIKVVISEGSITAFLSVTTLICHYPYLLLLKTICSLQIRSSITSPRPCQLWLVSHHSGNNPDSILEANSLKVSRDMEWENEWNHSGLASGLTPEVWMRSKHHLAKPATLRTIFCFYRRGKISGIAWPWLKSYVQRFLYRRLVSSKSPVKNCEKSRNWNFSRQNLAVGTHAVTLQLYFRTGNTISWIFSQWEASNLGLAVLTFQSLPYLIRLIKQ